MITRPVRSTGFTVVELLIGITILAVMIIPLYNVFFASAKMDKMSEALYVASTLSANYLEAVKTIEPDQFLEFPPMPDADLMGAFSLEELNLDVCRSPYLRLVEVEKGGDEGDYEVYCVTVEIKNSDEERFSYRASSLVTFKQ